MGCSEGTAVTFIQNFHTLIAIRFLFPAFPFNLDYRPGWSFSSSCGGGSCCSRGYFYTFGAILGIDGSVST